MAGETPHPGEAVLAGVGHARAVGGEELQQGQACGMPEGAPQPGASSAAAAQSKSRGCCSPMTEADGLGESHRQPGLPVRHPACPAGRRAGLHCLLLLRIGSPGLMTRLVHYKRRVLYLQGGSRKSGM